MSGGIRTISNASFVFVEPVIGFNERAIALLVPNDTLTQVDLWDTRIEGGFNSGQFDSTTGDFTVPTQGFYHLTAGIEFASNAIGTRLARIDLNDVSLFEETVDAVNGDVTFIKLAGGTVFLRSGDVLTLKVQQDSGGVVATTTNTTWSLFRQIKNI